MTVEFSAPVALQGRGAAMATGLLPPARTPMTDLLQPLLRSCALLTPRAAADEWRARTGRQVAGCMPGAVPDELPHAAGFLLVTPPLDCDIDLLVCAETDEPPGLPVDPSRIVRVARDGRAEWDRVRAALASIAGRPVTDRDLRWSIGVCNRNRMLMREMALSLIPPAGRRELERVRGFLPRERHSELLEEALEAAGPRRIVPRSPEDVATSGDPLGALARVWAERAPQREGVTP